MTPKERAEHLYSLADLYTHGYMGSSMLSDTEFKDMKKARSIGLANIMVNIAIDEWFDEYGRTAKQKYWNQVKEEINKL
jgi:hypothetical protein